MKIKTRMKTSSSLKRAIGAGAVLAVACAQQANASGLDSGTTAATTFKTFLYTFIGVVALCYLLYKGAMAFADREHWSDFAGACLKVAVVGSTVGVLGPYLWALFTS
ncbi:TrbC/VirB2 family protein [Paraburkholderia tropica]|uniref:TrbC/VirB2 family protein n=1 Tax=Paraburkholderia tropica TaxID=92647 RepID=UPI002AB672DC|nr:TrbC/VirB2 family protein [Paraburkholderia tropica]